RVNEGDKVSLDGSKSKPKGKPKGKDTIQSYFWKQVEVEGNPVTIKDADEVIASFIAPQISKNTKLTFKLIVRFASGKEDNDDTKVYVLDRDDDEDDDDRDANDPPRADAGPDQTVPEKTMVTLDGSNSSDPDDGIKSYLWEQTSGPSVSLSNPRAIRLTFTSPSVAGGKLKSLRFKLTVTDYGGSKDTDTIVVNVTGENDPPRADAGPDQNVDEETTVTLNGSNSFDPDDGIASYQWIQIAGPSVSLSNPQAVQSTFLAPNVEPKGLSFIFELTVTDYDSLQSTDTTIVNVIWLNDPPTANAGVDQTVLEKSTVTLDGSNSSDPDDGVVSYQWKQVAGQSVFLSDPTDDQPIFEAPSFNDSGDKPLIFELLVTDDGGLQSSDSTTVSVSNFEKDNPGASGGGCFITAAADG
ncbi:MAG: PKD domain-containing protein, partial [Syntrophobacteria bacterium]